MARGPPGRDNRTRGNARSGRGDRVFRGLRRARGSDRAGTRRIRARRCEQVPPQAGPGAGRRRAPGSREEVSRRSGRCRRSRILLARTWRVRPNRDRLASATTLDPDARSGRRSEKGPASLGMSNAPRGWTSRRYPRQGRSDQARPSDQASCHREALGGEGRAVTQGTTTRFARKSPPPRAPSRATSAATHSK